MFKSTVWCFQTFVNLLSLITVSLERHSHPLVPIAGCLSVISAVISVEMHYELISLNFIFKIKSPLRFKVRYNCFFLFVLL